MTVKLVLLIGILQLHLHSAIAQIKSHPNVVIILADDMGFGDVSSNNPSAKTKTPGIDKMSQTSIVFTDAHSGGAVCTPSRYGMLTGRYYFRLPKHQEFLGYLPPLIETGRETIGSLMQRAGYTTACIGKWHLGLNWKLNDNNKPQIPNQANKTVTNTNFSQNVSGGPNSLGFDYSYILPASLDMPPYVFVKNNKVIDTEIILTADAYPHKQVNTTYSWDRKHTRDDDVYWERGVWWRNGEMSKSFKMEDCLDTLVNQGMSFIRDQVKHQPKKPFMLYLPLTGPHTPWLPNQTFKGKSTMGVYGDYIAQIDNYVTSINNLLAELHIDQNTIVIFSSDNGAPWAEEDIQSSAHQSNYGNRGQKGDIWDGGHHIPLLIKWPAKIKSHFVYSNTVSLIDCLATFSEMTGEPIAGTFGEDSFSFYKVLTDHSSAALRDAIIYISSAGMLAIKKNGWKYIDGLGSGGFTSPGNVKPVMGGPLGQLYDLSKDPLETNNLYLNYPAKVKELSDLLLRYKEQGYSNEMKLRKYQKSK